MSRNYMPTFISLCRKLSVYVAEHDYKMLVALDQTEQVSEEEKQQIRDLFKQLKNMSHIFQKLDNTF